MGGSRTRPKLRGASAGAEMHRFVDGRSCAKWKAWSLAAALNIPANYNDIRIVRDGFGRLTPDGSIVADSVNQTSSRCVRLSGRTMPVTLPFVASVIPRSGGSGPVRPAGRDADNSASTDLESNRDHSALDCSIVRRYYAHKLATLSTPDIALLALPVAFYLIVVAVWRIDNGAGRIDGVTLR